MAQGITREALQRAIAGLEGARHIGATISGWSGSHVQALLQEAKNAIDGKAATNRGMPSGGAVGKVLKKNSATDYDATWQDDAAGGGVVDTPFGWEGAVVVTAAGSYGVAAANGAQTITRIVLACRVAPTGSGIVVALRIAGVDVAQLTLPTGQTSVRSSVLALAVADLALYGLTIESVGSTTPGTDLTAIVYHVAV